MIRTSKHNITPITNQGKLSCLDNLFIDYKHDLLIYINYIINGTLPIKPNLSSKLLPTEAIAHSRYKQLIYKHASEIIRSQLDKANKKRFNNFKLIYHYFKSNNKLTKFTDKKFSQLNLKNILKSKYFTIPNINNISINLDERFFNIQNGNHFDCFINIKLPNFNEKGTRTLQINIPLKHHKHSNSLSDDGLTLRKNIQIKCVNGNYYINLIWERVNTTKRTEGTILGIDTGYRKLIATSDNQMLGTDDMLALYKEICIKKKRNSNNYKKLLLKRDNLVKYYVNQINTEGVKTIVVEDLNRVRDNSTYDKKTNDKMSRWTYRPLLNKIEMMCEVKGIELVKVSPAYTSQTCSSCGAIHEENRNGDLFKCIDCLYEIDADYNASINIRNKGAYSLLSQ